MAQNSITKNSKSKHARGEWFGAAEAARLANLSLDMVNYLSRNEIVNPSCNCPRGYGRPRHYSFGDLVALSLVSKLSSLGVSPLRMKKGLKGLRRLHPQITLTSLPASHIVTDGRDLYLRGGNESLERVFDGQLAFAFVIELAPIQSELAKRLSSKESKTSKTVRRSKE